MNPAFGAADRLVLFAYAAFVLWLGLSRTRRRRERDDVASYLVAGRMVSLPAFVANLVATWYGGILGVGEYAYRYGVSNWLVFGVPYYLAALVFALFVAPRARRSQVLTIPEQLRAAYGPRTGVLGAVLVLFMTVPGAYVLMAGTIASEVFGLPLAVAVVGVTLLSGFYLVFGGMRSVVLADRFYFVLMYVGFAIMLVYLVGHYGGLGFLRASLDPQQFTWNGGRPVQAVLVWYVIALATLIEPSFYEACFSARDQRTARRGILVSILFWALFDFMTTATGLYARALLPDLAEPVRAFPLLGERVLPPLLLGLFFAGMLATVMSTVDSYLFIGAQTLGHDIVWRLRRGRRVDAAAGDVEALAGSGSNRWTRIALAVIAAAAIGIALSGLGVVEMWHHLGSIGTPALLVPMLSSLEPRWRMPPRAAAASIVLSGGTAAVWLASAHGGGGYWWGVEPIFPALALSLVIWAAGLSAARRRARV